MSYLIMLIDKGSGHIHGVGIYSEPHPTTDKFRVLLAKHEDHDHLGLMFMESEEYKWLRDLMDWIQTHPSFFAYTDKSL